MAKKKVLDLKELRIVFEKMDNGKGKLGLSLLNKAEFVEETLSKLQKKVEDDGVVTSMCQGNYDIDRENPALKSYNTTLKNYTGIVKQLNDMLPKEDNNSKDDDFDKDNLGDDE